MCYFKSIFLSNINDKNHIWKLQNFYLFVTVMIRNMIEETNAIVGYEVTACKHTGHLKKIIVIKPLEQCILNVHVQIWI